jgi:hypothetical protein
MPYKAVVNKGLNAPFKPPRAGGHPIDMKTTEALAAAAVAALCACGAAGALTGPEVAAKVYEVSKADEASYAGFDANALEIVADDAGKEMTRVTGRVYFTKPDTQRFEITEYIKDGKKQPIPKDDEKKKDDDDFTINGPFDEKYFSSYTFTLEGTEEVTGVPCYKVAYAAPGKGKGYIYGAVWVATDDFRTVKTSGKPYVQPKNCSASSMTVFFRDAGGRAMPYKQVIYVKGSFLKVITKEMWITSYITDYKFH